ncbi:MAG TPA: aminotransferase class I/II-fold pyridoxal phosphate-dependent enzyme [Candidatus Levybacteria bacterium]|nr:aminotransferase class I/II-fold pyridoxal phosphate-dependent enzyme [Candidatus Levybacteria bacterium]
MNIFNSLGSNYTFSFVLNSLKKRDVNSRSKLSKYLQKRYSGEVILTHKGRDAMGIALRELSLPPKSKIAVTGFTCIAVIESIEKQNLTAYFLDIDEKSLNFTSEELEKAIQKEKIKAVIVQNTLGFPCNIEKIQSICKKHHIVLIEDLAHSIGTVYQNGNEAGTVGDFTVLSFSQDKVVDSVSGGAVIARKHGIKNTKEKKSKESNSEKIYPLLTWTIRKTYPIKIGVLLHIASKKLKFLSDPMKNSTNQKLTSWHAGLILSGFNLLAESIQHKRNIAQIYTKYLPEYIQSNEISKLIPIGTNLRFPIFIKNRDSLIAYLQTKGVYVSDIWYDAPVAPKKYLGLARYPKDTCPNAQNVANRIINLPTHKNISEKNARTLSKLITVWLQQNK